MSADMNKNTTRRMVEEVFNKGKLSVIQEICLPNVLLHDPIVPNGEVRGQDGFSQYVSIFRTAFPDLNLTIEDQIVQGDEVVTRYIARGTHRGDLMGIAPTGKKVTVTGMVLDRYSHGKLIESWNQTDNLGLMQQLGVVPATAQSETPARARR